MRQVGAWPVLGNGDRVPMTTPTQVRSHTLAADEDSTVVGAERTSISCCTRLYDPLEKVRVEHDVVVDV